MPLHSYSTTRRPPSVMDHVYAHPFELILATAGVLAGLASIAAALTHVATSPAMALLPPWVLLPFGLLLPAGGVLMATGIYDDSDDLMRGWRIERVGLVASGFGWAAFGIATAGLPTGNPVGVVLCCLFALAMVLRFRATVLEERRVRGAIAQGTP